MRKAKRQKYKNNIILNHILKNERQYVIAGLVFIIGLLIGITVFNSSDDMQKTELVQKITTGIYELKNANNNTMQQLINSLKSNAILITVLWILGSTIIGIIGVALIVAFRGFCFGYTICSIIYTIGTFKGLAFSITSLLLHNVIFIPILLFVFGNCINLCKFILTEKSINIKLLLLKHTSVCMLALIVVSLSSFVEIYVSKFLTFKILDYIKF